MHLTIGNKNYSSWSFRPWFAMKVAGIPFDETVISLNAPDFKERLLKISGTGKVPTLVDGEVKVWESLAILEYLAESGSGGETMARGPIGASPRAGDRERNACGFRAVAASVPDEHVAPRKEAHARC